MTDPAAGQHKICILDDDPGVRQSLQFLLEAHGFAVRTYGGALAFLATLDPDDVDCLVIDYKMPEMDGLDVAAHLRQRHIEAPIILITGYPDLHMAEKAATAGIDDVLFKPHLEDSLVKRIRHAIARR